MNAPTPQPLRVRTRTRHLPTGDVVRVHVTWTDRTRTSHNVPQAVR